MTALAFTDFRPPSRQLRSDDADVLTGIFADDVNDIDTDQPGSHYAMDRKQLMSSHGWLDGYGDNKYLLTIHAKKGQVDVRDTLKNRVLFPHENEITLKDKGEGVEIISIQEIVGNGLGGNLYTR